MNLTVFNQDLLPVYTTDTGEKVVLGRELHEKLGIGASYSTWFKRMCAYDFVKESGYTSFSAPRSDGKDGRPKQEHLLNLEIAKEIARIQRTQIGSLIVEKFNELQGLKESKSVENNLTVFSNDLIPVYTTDTGEKVVLGRELHEKLGIITEYPLWFQRMCEYGKDKGFREGESYYSVSFKSEENCQIGGRPKQDHIISLRMAKHIATIQKTNVGFNIREKLFEIQEMVSEQRVQQPLDSYMIDDPIKRAERWIEEKKIQIALEEENKRLLPKAEGFDKFLNTKGLTCFRNSASLLGIGEKVFIEWLLTKGFIYRKSDKKGTLLPYSEYKVKPDNPNGLFVLKKRPSQYDKNKFFEQTRITPQGLETFRKMLKKEGMIQ